MSSCASSNVTGAYVIQALLCAGLLGMFYLVVLYLRRIKGYSPFEVGAAYVPSMIAMGVMSLRVSSPVIMRYGRKATLIPCAAVYVVSLLPFARIPVHSTYGVDILPPVLLVGLSAGLSYPAVIGLSMSGVPRRDSGLASGLINTSGQVGSALGLAVLATVAAARTASRLHAGVAANVALTDGYRLAFVISAVLVMLALLVAVFVIRTEGHSVEKKSDSLAEYAVPTGPGRSFDPAGRAGRHERRRLPGDALRTGVHTRASTTSKRTGQREPTGSWTGAAASDVLPHHRGPARADRYGKHLALMTIGIGIFGDSREPEGTGVHNLRYTLGTRTAVAGVAQNGGIASPCLARSRRCPERGGA